MKLKLRFVITENMLFQIYSFRNARHTCVFTNIIKLSNTLAVLMKVQRKL